MNMELLPADWNTVFGFETPLLELIARGTALYVGILILLRLMPRRAGGELGVMDLVFILLVTEAASHSLGDYASVADGMLQIVVIMGWDFLVNYLSYHVPFFERLVTAPPIEVIRDGRLLRRNMRKEYLTEDELMSFLSQEGIEDVADVKRACVEGEGRLTAIKRKGSGGA